MNEEYLNIQQLNSKTQNTYNKHVKQRLRISYVTYIYLVQCY